MDIAAPHGSSTNGSRRSRRRTRRIPLTVPVEISGQDVNRASFTLMSVATNLNRNGGSVHLSRDLSVSSVLLLKNNRGTQVPARVVAQTSGVRDLFVFFHDFRHTFSAAMRKAGVDLKVRSAVLGHKGKIGVLAHDVYDGVKPSEIRHALVLGASWLQQEETMQRALLSNQLFPQMFPRRLAA